LLQKLPTKENRRFLNLFTKKQSISKESMEQNNQNKIKEQIIKNLKRCPYFNRCNQNLCPLDFELYLRSGDKNDKCRWMREPKKVRIKDKVFVSGGQVMPDALLNFVPESNLKWLNRASRKRWKRLKNKS
jgi:hypothetical protein